MNDASYRDIARRKWRNADIQGSGEFGVLISCYEYKGVRLHTTMLAARAALLAINQNGCGHAFCLYENGHRLFQLEPDPPRAPWRNPADQERDPD
jgi:hypothetical protein